jgi:hypothetical protein
MLGGLRRIWASQDGHNGDAVYPVGTDNKISGDYGAILERHRRSIRVLFETQSGGQLIRHFIKTSLRTKAPMVHT